MSDLHTPANHRSAPRVPAQDSVWLRCRPTGSPPGANIANGLLDVSEGGIQLLSRELVQPGDEVEISLGGPSFRELIRRMGLVRWVVPFGSGACCAGIRFHEPLDIADFDTLTRAFVDEAEPDSCVFNF